MAVSVLELVGREVKGQLSMSTWHLIYSYQSFWELFPGLRSCWWICPVCFLPPSWGNLIFGFGFTTFFLNTLYTSHHKTVQTLTMSWCKVDQKFSLEIPRFDSSEFHVLSQSINPFLRNYWAIFSFFLFPKYRIFQPSDSEFGKVMDNSRLSFALSSIAQLWYEVELPVQLQSRIQM